MFWSAVASGYLIYGWKQRAMVPLVAGIGMTVAAWVVPALPMSLICIILIGGAWWLVRRGY
ncbi:MAG: hypothetical protein ACRED1_15430 [Limisphaerales bacterium]